MAAPERSAARMDAECEGELTADESWQFFDGCARRYLGIGGDEFIRRWKAGEYADPDGTQAMYVIMALPFARDRL